MIGPGFVEAGVFAQPIGEYYYFADINDTGVFHFNIIQSVPSIEIGRNTIITIWQNPGASWSIRLHSSDPNGYSWSGYSTPATWNANQLWIGQAVTGTGGSYSSSIHWTQSIFELSDGTWHYQFRPNPAPGDGNRIQFPVHAGWASLPSNGSPSGGDWFAYTNP